MTAAFAFLSACMLLSAPVWAGPAALPVGNIPVLLVRGMMNRDRSLRYIKTALEESGAKEVDYGSYDSFFGEGRIETNAEQLETAAKALMARTKTTQIDIVAYSMGALSIRYMIQRLGGKDWVRKFISISGPHQGTYMAYLPQFLGGIYQMRPGSDLLADLASDTDPWGKVEVYSFYTRYDAVVLPGSSGILPASKEVRSYEVAFHHLMLKDRDVIRDVVRILRGP